MCSIPILLPRELGGKFKKSKVVGVKIEVIGESLELSQVSVSIDRLMSLSRMYSLRESALFLIIR